MKRPTHPHEHYSGIDNENCRLLEIHLDYAGAFLWQGGVLVSVESFGGSAELCDRFYEWARQWENADPWSIKIDPDDPWWKKWEAQGLCLAQEFQTVLKPEYTLWYYSLNGDPKLIG